ncbi:unnamed protein product [Caenorhabditis auriculariae]|uniref:Uncharacterized protein n=1 Tax=Caenorhabditis auriculariae TaxID=2777116 RepID=A0A8S1HEA2_9PELO|nr:unnamed protein product [Caenorhabditis auriculariae]
MAHVRRHLCESFEAPASFHPQNVLLLSISRRNRVKRGNFDAPGPSAKERKPQLLNSLVPKIRHLRKLVLLLLRGGILRQIRRKIREQQYEISKISLRNGCKFARLKATCAPPEGIREMAKNPRYRDALSHSKCGHDV